MLGKKALAIIVSVLMLASGIYLASTYSSAVKAQQVTNQGAIPILADSYQSIAFSPQSGGYYIFQASTDHGTIQGFLSPDNRTYGTWQNGTICPIQPLINGSSGETGGGFTGVRSEYFILLNPNALNEQVNYNVTYHWSSTNYTYLMAGIALIALAAITLCLTMLSNKLIGFKKTLKNPE